MSERDSRDPRPVEEFFAAERAAVHPAEAGEDRWEQIVHQSTRGGRPWFALFMGALGALAAVVLFWSTQQAPFGEGSVDPGREVEAATNNAPVEASGDPRDTSPAQAPIEVPASFVPWSMSNAGSGTVFAMGAAPCGADEEVCPTVVRSTDNGSTWTAVHRFQRTDTASVTSDEVPRIQPPRAVSEVRFATPKIGYAFGGDLWMTRDAGRSFTRYAHPGQTVLDVEIFRGDVLVLSADGCSQGRCSGPLMLSRTTVQAGAVQQPVAVRDLDTPVDDAQVVVRDGAVYVQPYRVDAGNVGSPWRLEENELVPMTARDGCGTNPLQSLTASTNGAGTLFALCGGDLRGDQAEYRLMRSDDRGKTWRPATTTPVVLPRVGRLTLAASDAQHLAVATGGPRQVSAPTRVTDLSRLLQVTDDGGKTWRPVDQPQPPPQGFDWVASPGGQELYAITRSGTSVWRSADLGATWQLVDPTKPVNPPPSSSPPPTSGEPSSPSASPTSPSASPASPTT